MKTILEISSDALVGKCNRERSMIRELMKSNFTPTTSTGKKTTYQEVTPNMCVGEHLFSSKVAINPTTVS